MWHGYAAVSCLSVAQPNDVFMWRDWQEGLKALLPNVNISFGNPPHGSVGPTGLARGLGQSNGYVPSQTNSAHLPMQSALPADKSEWLAVNFTLLHSFILLFPLTFCSACPVKFVPLSE